MQRNYSRHALAEAEAEPCMPLGCRRVSEQTAVWPTHYLCTGGEAELRGDRASRCDMPCDSAAARMMAHRLNLATALCMINLISG